MDLHARARFAHRLVTVEHALARVHGTGVAGRFNRRLAVWITNNVGTMWCAYLFTVIGAIGIVASVTGSVFLVLIVGAVSGYFLQLVLLPIIIVGQNVQAEATNQRAEADHETIQLLQEINAEQLRILKLLEPQG